MTTLANGLSAFYNDLAAHGKADNVVIMTWSEFGRRVEENGSVGTDHGTAAPLFVLGNPINKGIFGEPPSLSNLDSNGNLKYTIDFRSLYAAVLEYWVNVSCVNRAKAAFTLGIESGWRKRNVSPNTTSKSSIRRSGCLSIFTNGFLNRIRNSLSSAITLRSSRGSDATTSAVHQGQG